MGARTTVTMENGVTSVLMDDGKVNALSFDMFEELNAALDQAAEHDSAVVLAGRDGVFSAGFDLKVMKAGGPDMRRLLKTGFEFSYRLLSYERPVVIAATGHTFAMGTFVLLSGDYRIGAAGAEHRITANEVAIGMVMPRTAIEICRHRLSLAVLERVVVQAEVFDPDSAVAAQLLDGVVPGDQLVAAAQEKAAALGALDTTAFKYTKLRVHAGTLEAMRAAIAADDDELSTFEE
jgi:enoyl-CoA hydratase